VAGFVAKIQQSRSFL